MDHEDAWRALQEEVLQDDGDDGMQHGQLTGELHIPTLPAQKKKVPRTVAPKSSTMEAAKPPKAKQQTLAQSMSDKEMDRLFSRFREQEKQSGDVDDVDITKYLKDDDDDGMDLGDTTEVNASDLFATLIHSKANAMEDTSQSAQAASDDEAAPAAPVIGIHDEVFEFETAKTRKAAPVPTPKAEGAGYLAVEVPTAKVELVEKLNTQRTPQEPTAASTATDAAPQGLFYWFDAKEQPHTLSVDPGSLFLFGKMMTGTGPKAESSSCCVRVRNIERNVFLLPAEGSSDMDVIREVNDLCRRQGIEQRRIKFVERYYAFENPTIPREKTRWAKLRYPARFPPLADSTASLKHVSAILGCSTSLLELVLLKRGLKGPSYLRISNLVPATNRISHCALEFTVDSPKNVTVEETSTPPPPFTMASIQLHTQLDDKGMTNEVIAAAVAVYRDVNIESMVKTTPSEIYTGIRPVLPQVPLPMDLESFSRSKGLPGVQRFQNERALLVWLAATLGTIDADILMGHNFLGFTLDVLLRRYQEMNVTGWSTVGRLDFKRFPRLNGPGFSINQEREACAGRLVADSYLLTREYYKSVNYKLSALAEEMPVHGITRGGGAFEPGSSAISHAQTTSSKDLFDILLQVANFAVLSMGVIYHLDAVRLTKRLTSIVGNLWSRTLCGARSERIEFLLLHAFHSLKFIIPDKPSFASKRGRDEEPVEDEGKRKAKYQGGMVLDPKCGLYSDYVLVLDFNSLYPSLIQEFNVCFTTVDRFGDEEVTVPAPENLVCRACAAEGLPAPCLHRCVLPKVIKGLVDSRRDVRRLMKTERDPAAKGLYNIRQLALKLIANSMYGCLGFVYSRFYAQPLAELVTRQGRLALQNTVDLIPQVNPSLRVIYGDTDSVMMQTGIKDDIKAVRDLGMEVRNKVNQRYQSLEIDIDNIFRAILLLKKKKYAALAVTDWQGAGVTYKREVKGLDMVRRDWCPLTKRVSDAVLTRVLGAEGSEDVLDYVMNYMRGVAEQVRRGDTYTLDEFVISKSLTKEPESYKGTAFPHATVALRMKARKELVRVGDLIPYVMCTEGEKMSDRARHVDEMRRDTSLHIDAEWYLATQIYPPVMRLCEHIQGFSNAQLSESMGIAYNAPAAKEEEEEATGANDFSYSKMFKSRELAECFPTALPLQVQCTHCLGKTPIDPHQRVLDELARDPSSRTPFDLYVCLSCGRSLPVDFVANCFTQTCYTLLRQFYLSGGGVVAVRAIRSQFTYFRALFDVPHAPGCPQAVKDCHQLRARRCLGIDRNVYTLAQAQDPVVADEHDPVDPLHAAAETFYKRIENLFISLDSLFGDMKTAA